MRITEMEFRMRILKNAFMLKLRRVTVSDSHVSFPWLPLLWKIALGLPGYIWKQIISNEK
ncbi:hypothetical protein [Desulfovibrio intestinalis]|uniref:Uncharacterized protein n=1 Tax=Desulfovibrio intestinalis TaxID=58621 RepID=A0A7W8BYB2_9BACT|nr:hypothetical protein [Desulfovibrio intestinalis]MBB5142195.1 hypothetical protein [Desulfovibrio intestinalis]